MKRLLSGLLLLFSCTPVDAQGVHEWINPKQLLPTRAQFIRLLTDHGLDISYKNGCGHSGTSLAHYRPGSNTMCLPNTEKAFDSALTHEAVHVLQDCLSPNGLRDDRMVTIHSYLKRVNDDETAADFKAGVKESLRVLDDIEHIQHHYKSAHRDAEAEAYALEHNPRFVYGLLKICLEHS